jgi:ketosteroid isomerase-like protein
MEEHPNVALMRKGYAAFGSGDMATLGELLASDVVWHEPGNSPLSGDYAGQEATFGLFGKLFELSAGDLTQELHAVLADDEHGVALLKQHIGRPDGRSYDGSAVHVFHLKGGKVVEFWGYSTDQAAADAVLA